jgi:Uma2 family endonuclease
MSARIEPLMTVDDLEAMPEDSNRYEVIEGELFVSCAPGLTHQLVTSNINYVFRLYLEQHPIGTIVSTPGLILDLYSGVIPDVVFFTHQRGAEIIAKERLNAAPELVIEILSSGASNIARDRVAKLQLYGKHKVGEYWIVDIENQCLEVYRPPAEKLELTSVLRANDELTSPLLPGFITKASAILKV